MQYVLYRRYRISPSLFTTSQWSKCKDRRDGEEKVAWGFFFIALNITDLKLYFFLGETMKHEKEREGEITDTADTSKCSKETRQGTQHGTDR